MRLTETVLHLFHPRRSNNRRARILHPELLLAIGMMVAVLGVTVHFGPELFTQFGSVLGYASDITVDQVISQTNAQRAAGGLGALQSNGVLAAAAAQKASDMFANQYWAHTSPQGKEPWDFIKAAGYSYRVAGENLARDFSVTPEMITAWMNSPTHRANIMNSRYQEIGVAVVNGTLNGVETTLVVQMFGTPLTAAAQIPAQATAQVVPTSLPTAAPTIAVSPEPSAAVAETIPTNSPPELSPATPQVRGESQLPTGSLQPAGYSPLLLAKAIGISVLLLLCVTLLYDLFAVGHYHSSRIVGKNLAHLLLFAMVAFLLLVYKSGSIDLGAVIGG